MKKITWMFFAVSLLFIAGCNRTNDWYDYGNGRINLSQVHHIKPSIDSTLTFSDTSLENVGTEHSDAITQQSISAINGYLTKDYIARQNFYKVKIDSYIMFDGFKLVLFESKTYFKKPSVYSINDFLISEFSKAGLNSENVAKLTQQKGKLFNDRKSFEAALSALGVNTESDWMKNKGIYLGFGENGIKFLQQNGIDKNDVPLDDSALAELSKELDYSLTSYAEIPTKGKFF